MIFTADELRDLLWGDSETLEVVKNNIIDTGRWSIYHELVFKDNKLGQYYRTTYSEGATEHQDEQPFEYQSEIDCKQVFPITKEITVYE